MVFCQRNTNSGKQITFLKTKFPCSKLYLPKYTLGARIINNIYFWLLLDIQIFCLTLKQLGGKGNGGGGQFEPPCGFSNNVSSKERVKRCFFGTFNIIISHIFPENFIEIPQVDQKIWGIFLSILAIFIDFDRFFGFFDRWCQYFFTFNIL